MRAEDKTVAAFRLVGDAMEKIAAEEVGGSQPKISPKVRAIAIRRFNGPENEWAKQQKQFWACPDRKFGGSLLFRKLDR